MTPPAPTPPGAVQPPDRSARRGGRGPALFAASMMLIIAAALIVPLPLYTETPTPPADLAERIAVEGGSEVHGAYLLMTVRLRQASLADAVRAWLDPAASVLSRQQVVPPGVSDEEHFETQRHVFQSSADVAAALGLQAAGFDVDPADVAAALGLAGGSLDADADAVDLTGDGVEVVAVRPGGPAHGLLDPGDVITAVDGRTVGTHLDLRRAVVATADGDTLRLRVDGPAGQRTETLTPRTDDAGAGRSATPMIGVELRTVNPRAGLPVAVDIDQQDIGGPSAGLMIALAVFDQVDATDLAGGRIVAGSGGVSPHGDIAPVGGIPQKVIAAEREGAEVFLLAPTQLDEARAALPPGSSLDLVPVATLADAVQALEAGSAGPGSAEGIVGSSTVACVTAC